MEHTDYHKPRYMIIPSGGVGSRMGAGTPKQYLHIGDRPILIHTLLAIESSVDHIIIGVADSYRHRVEELLTTTPLHTPVQLTSAGETRFDTVRQALSVTPDEVLVGIHDAVRPFVSGDVVEECFALAAKHGAAAPCLPMSESVRRIEGPHEERSVAVDRAMYRLVRTPQVFRSERLKEAYRLPYREELTDDCSVYDQLYDDLQLVLDHNDNIKLTTPDQLYWANHMIRISEQERLRQTRLMMQQPSSI